MFTFKGKIDKHIYIYLVLFVLSILMYVTFYIYFQVKSVNVESKNTVNSFSINRIVESNQSSSSGSMTEPADIEQLIKFLSLLKSNVIDKMSGDKEEYGEYIIKERDTLSEIANKFNITLTELMTINSIQDPHLIYPNVTIKIPFTSKSKIVITSKKTVTIEDYMIFDLRQPSNLTANELNNFLKDTKLEGLGQSFLDAEKKYNVNAIYLMSHAIHESDWGNSKIAIEKNNLFGFKAYDSSPYDNAKKFTSMEESIDYTARFIANYYLNEQGKYFNGPNLIGMNKNYATSKQWASKIAVLMKKFNSVTAL